MARTWLSIDVELVSGRGVAFWPRPGRIFAAARSHTFWDLAEGINTHFGRWDHGHLSEFTLDDSTLLAHTDSEVDPPDNAVEITETTLSRLTLGEQFAYVFDLGDYWTHLCTVGAERIDPEIELGIIPDQPTPYWGWGTLLDQYGRQWRDDDGETSPPPDPKGADLPPILADWR